MVYPEDQITTFQLSAIDMYYMDLNGVYIENIPHSYNPCDAYQCDVFPDSCTCYNDDYSRFFRDEYLISLPLDASNHKENYSAEIWVSRIMGHNLNLPKNSNLNLNSPKVSFSVNEKVGKVDIINLEGRNINFEKKTEVEIIREYFNWNHIYRSSLNPVLNKAYMLDGISLFDIFPRQDMDFLSIFRLVVNDYVTKVSYLNYLQDIGGSELFYLESHSGHNVHTFYKGNPIFVDELINFNKTSIFYIMNACSSCRWDYGKININDSNYLCGEYVFDKRVGFKNFGLGAIGFTSVGGFNQLNFFTEYLSQYKSNYGLAYKYWFNKNLQTLNFGLNNYVFLGDPTIKPTYKNLNVVSKSFK